MIEEMVGGQHRMDEVDRAQREGGQERKEQPKLHAPEPKARQLGESVCMNEEKIRNESLLTQPTSLEKGPKSFSRAWFLGVLQR
jgi:hypothetical protein